MERAGTTYYDRAAGRLETERVYAGASLDWLYNSRAGAAILPGLVGGPAFSRLWGWAHRRRFSRRWIRPFVERMGVDASESLRPLEDFESFSDFFVRAIHPSRRPVRPEPGVCIAPADGKVLAYPVVDARASFRIKRSTFDLGGLLRDEATAGLFAGGSMVVSRLSLADCHHFHFPDSGTPGEARSIAGLYHAGGPYARRGLVPFFTENHRMVTRLESDHFGPVAQVEVGALTVGSVRQRYRPGVRAAKGQAKGVFELGGSSVVLLFRRGAIVLDPDLCARTTDEVETYVRMGDSIGRAR